LIVEFIVNANGKVESPKIIWSSNDTANTRAIQLINTMPLWLPGLKDDLPVATRLRLPIIYYRPVKEGNKLSDHEEITKAGLRNKLYFDIDYPGAKILPSFPGGKVALKQYLAKNLKYPRIAEENGVVGVEWVEFRVNKDGVLSNFFVKSGIGAGCDEEALRLFEMMPNWIPATLDGQPIDSKHSIGIEFRLDTEKAPQLSKDDQFPRFSGGNIELQEFIYSNIQYTDSMKKDMHSGIVFIQFVVEEDGSLTNPSDKIKTMGKPYEDEALRVVKLMPNWIPGFRDGKPVRKEYILHIAF
jgi:hypothetical protein